MCLICCFSLAAFNICSLCLIFINFINMCLAVFCLGFILFGNLWVSWAWVAISFPILGKFSTITSSSIFSCPFFLFFFFFWGSYDSNVGVYHCPRCLWGCPHFFFFFFFPLCFFYFHHSTFHLTYPIFYLQLFYCWFPPECFWSHLFHYSLLIDSLSFLLGPC